ncbi:NUDIX domain-containing protein [Nocardioides sp.]|uniref:NUDIX domain-containing protein n=1 Tax=Nocardioides sp. TaxID=35761 RepID=UPI00356944A5
MPELAPSDLSDTPESWPVVTSEDLHRDGWVLALRADRIRRPGGGEEAPFRRLVLEHPGAAVVLALDEDDRALVVRQYRHPVLRRFVELPAGLVDQPGEDPLEVAQRELVEEAGFEAATWTRLGATYSSPGISAELIHLFLARDLRPADRDGFVLEHEEADMQVLWMRFDDLMAGVLEGRIADAPVVSAVLLAHAKGLVGG